MACKKDKGYIGIEKSNISLGDKITPVWQSEEFTLFKSGEIHRSYFAASGIQLNDSTAFFISTRSITDDDYAAGDLISKQVRTSDSFLNLLNIDGDVFKENDAKMNVVSPNIYRYKGELHVIYLKQESYDVSDIYIVKSLDEGTTWSEEKKINTKKLFHIIMNNSVTVTKSGRIIVAAATTANIEKNYNDQAIICYYSDDNGKTWSSSSRLVSNTPLMEPSIAQLNSGKLLMVIRSRLGKLLFSESPDNGATWSKIKMSNIDAPASQPLLSSIGNQVALVWNNTPPGKHVFDRNPLSLSTTEDGITWSSPVTIAGQDSAMYSSPSIFKLDNTWVLLYNKSLSSNASKYDMVFKILKLK